MGGGGIHLEGPNYRFGLKQVLEHVMDLGILLLAVTFRVVLPVPKAESQDLIGVSVRNQNSLVHESRLLFENGQNLVVNGVAEVLCLSWFGGEFYDPRKTRENTPFCYQTK